MPVRVETGAVHFAGKNISPVEVLMGETGVVVDISSCTQTPMFKLSSISPDVLFTRLKRVVQDPVKTRLEEWALTCVSPFLWERWFTTRTEILSSI